MQVLLLGAGGHARSVADAIDVEIDGVVVDRLGQTPALRAPRMLTDADVLDMSPDEVELVNGVGQVSPWGARWEVYRHFADRGFRFRRVIHPTAYVSVDAELGDGVQVLARAIVGPGARISSNSLVNSGAIVEHDCRVGSGVHLGPGSVLCGDASIGDGTLLGAGATVVPGRSIGTGATVGAAALVLHDVADGTRVGGVPAAILRDLEG